MIERTTFGKTGLSVSRLGFGAAPIGYLKTDEERAGRVLHLLLDSGVNLLDTAASYHGSEELIGNAVASRREQYVLVSKCGHALPDVKGEEWSRELIAGTIDRSLRNLKTDRLDVMLLHSCGMDILKKGEALGALVKAREAGKVRFVGYSGDNEEAAYAATLPDVAVLEMSLSIADQANARTALPKARENNLGVLAKRPIANAAWKDPSEQPGLYQSYSRPYYDRIRAMKLNPTDLGFVGPTDGVWPELALRFTLSFPGVHCAIIGTTNPDNARANIAYAEKGPLPEDVVHKIEEVFRDADPEGIWTAQR
ncbi:MAG: aldo/keto reductase [Massilia sp.]|nr:aldo/keto reductase [Massilia sp.]